MCVGGAGAAGLRRRRMRHGDDRGIGRRPSWWRATECPLIRSGRLAGGTIAGAPTCQAQGGLQGPSRPESVTVAAGPTRAAAGSAAKSRRHLGRLTGVVLRVSLLPVSHWYHDGSHGVLLLPVEVAAACAGQ